MSQALSDGDAPAVDDLTSDTLDDARTEPRVRLRRWLAHRRAPILIIALALVLTAGALDTGFMQDDYLHWSMLNDHYGRAQEPWWRALDLFRFADSDAVRAQALREEGVYPWWSDPEVRIAFFRPLSSLSHTLDHALFAGSPLLMHAHSLLWFVGLLFAVAAVYRRFCPSPWVAGLALLLYAIDDARAFPAGWLSNRNALIASAPSLLALLAYDRFRREGARRDALLALGLLALGLSGGETAFAVYGYFLAYALTFDRGTLQARLRALAPSLLLLIAWRVATTALGYGTHGTGFYVDPLTQPIVFVRELAINIPLLTLSMFALPWAESWDLAQLLAPAVRTPLLIAAYVFCALLLWFGRRFVRDPGVRFWALGSFLALLPVSAVAAPNDRLLIAAGVGGSALVAHVLATVAERTFPGPRVAGRITAVLLVAVHLVIAPLSLSAKARSVGTLDVRMREADASLPEAADFGKRELVLLNVPLDPFGSMFLAARRQRGLPTPGRFRWLAVGVSNFGIKRLDPYTLELRAADGFFTTSSQWVWREPTKPFGESVQLEGATFTVVALTADGRPASVRVRFAEPLESERYLWMRYEGPSYIPFTPPAVGESVTLPAADMQKLLLGAPTNRD